MTLLGNLAERARDKLRNWGWNWDHADWSSWRTYTPAAGSAIVHVTLLGAIVAFTAAFSERAPDPVPRVLEVTLLEDTPPPPPPDFTRETPPAPPVAERAPDAASILPPRKKTDKPSAVAPQPSASAAAEGEYIPPSPLAPGVAGLAGLIADPCKAKKGLKIENCDSKFSDKLAEAKAWENMSKAEKEQFYAEFTPDCPYRVGCDTGPWRGAGGTRSVFRPNGGPMMGGAASLGGIHDLVGRLGFNPEHTDPGFGD